jgi:predicted ribosomally synthesized peptide with nif11-like leader
MSDEQFTALLTKHKEDAGLREKFQGAADLETALSLAKEAGLDVSKADWLKFQGQQTLDLNDEELSVPLTRQASPLSSPTLPFKPIVLLPSHGRT